MQKKIINSILISILIFVFISCNTNKFILEKIQGTYIQKENKRIALNFKDKNFVIVDNFEPTHLAIQEYKCCDTIAYGDWSLIKNQNFISLKTNEVLDTFYLNIDVEEKNTNEKDITFIIDNPIEKGYKNLNSTKELLYSISITKQDGEIVEKTSTNKIISISNVNEISMFEITIYPKCNIPLRHLSAKVVYTMPYTVKANNSNVFKVNISDLTYKYLTLKRMNKDYVRVRNNNKLIWDGKEYIKK
ncbi:hypothetical protein [Polaribacter porphyrae]|uniref:Lipoprotein n=1 Tax=Polaribacter porphyrae TaxID=1137780 RepID=A0A2S7WSI2_9FLAO|nr:hypothetical protein [Polaribacter porphyrae]PQJ80282.1 hypothetical protein BTO18_14325 [Polaribacter porphyrae]